MFIFTHLLPILLIIAVLWGISYFVKKQRSDKSEQQGQHFSRSAEGPKTVHDDQPSMTRQKKPIHPFKATLNTVEEQFKQNQALNLGDGFWVDQARQKVLVVLGDDDTDDYLEANFSDIQKYFTQFESDYSKTYAIHFKGMADNDFANVTLSKQSNDLLGQSPVDYLQTLLSHYGVPLKKKD
ncbi:hypothetical protein [Fructobacillus durionis]|nr:hypothetical protein [Fructobacillus durionis]